MHTGQLETLEDVVEHYSTLADASPRTHGDTADVLVALHLTSEQQHQLVPIA